MQDINVKTTLPALSFDYEGLKAWANGITEQYTGLVVQEDDLAGIKSEMAGLNKIKKNLDDARKETVKQVSGPIKHFEDQIKEVCGIFSDTYAFLSEQVKAYEERAREEKRQQVQFMIDAALDEHGVTGLRIDINPSWLNKIAKDKAVKAEIDALILAHIKAEREARELEQARKDRAVAIEQTCASLSGEYGVTLPPSQFLRLQDLSIPLEDVNMQIAKAYELRAAAVRQKTESPAQHTQAHTPPRPCASKCLAPANTGPFDAKHTITIELTYTDSQADAVEDVLRNLQAVSTNLIISATAAAA